MKKPVKIVKFMKICQTGKILTKDGQRETVLELGVPPNLLKKENVCLIPREAEHPSNLRRFSSEIVFICMLL